jgi:hypothetical protein
MTRPLLIHIPKTGITALKYTEHYNPGAFDFEIARFHRHTLVNTRPRQIIFGIRDPWQRFCSGFWERATTYLRKDIYEKHHRANHVPTYGYSDYRRGEDQIFKAWPTPNALITYWRMADRRWGAENLSIPFWEIVAPITVWLGDVRTYQQNESRVVWAYDTDALDNIMQGRYGVSITQDPFLRRSRQVFDLDQSYEISAENFQWFREVFRKPDYDLIDYIRSRSYLRSS